MRTLPPSQREAIGNGVRAAAEKRRATLKSLRDSRQRVIQALVTASVYVDSQARLGDPLAGVLLEQIESAFDALEAENIGATTYLATTEPSPQPQVGSQTGKRDTGQPAQ